MKYRVRVDLTRDGFCIASCDDLPGCVSEGVNREEAIKNLQGAISAYLQSLKKHREEAPFSFEEEIIEVAS